MSNDGLWEPFATRLQSFIDIAPGDVETVVGYLDAKQHGELFSGLRGSPKQQQLLGRRTDSLFTQGRGAIVRYPNDKAKKWAIENGPRYGMDVDPDDPAFVFPLGERQKWTKKALSFNDLLFTALGRMMYDEEEQPQESFTEGNKDLGRYTSKGSSYQIPEGEATLDDTVMGLLDKFEGFIPYVYDDKTGKAWGEEPIQKDSTPTIGGGHAIFGDGTHEENIAAFLSQYKDSAPTPDDLKELFERDMLEHKDRAVAGMGDSWDGFTPELQAGLISAVFNWGSYTKWPKFTAAIKEGRWDDAILELDDWTWVQDERREDFVARIEQQKGLSE